VTTEQRNQAFDIAYALSSVDGDRDLLMELVTMFREELPSRVEEIRLCATNEDADGLARATHALRGSLGCFAARGAMDAALHLETMGRARSLGEVAAALVTLERELAYLEHDLTQLEGGAG
jgi:protein-histidine pros-kinase